MDGFTTRPPAASAGFGRPATASAVGSRRLDASAGGSRPSSAGVRFDGGGSAAAGGAGAPASPTLRLPPGATTSLSALLKSKTVNSAKTVVVGGELLSVAFPTSAKPFRGEAAASTRFGATSAVLNAPGKMTTTARKSFTATNTLPQSVGSVRKLAVPYKPTAARSRLRVEFKRDPLPFTSTITFDMGVVNKPLRPYRTVAAATYGTSTVPMHERVGFTNAAITADVAKRLHKPVFAS